MISPYVFEYNIIYFIFYFPRFLAEINYYVFLDNTEVVKDHKSNDDSSIRDNDTFNTPKFAENQVSKVNYRTSGPNVDVR